MTFEEWWKANYDRAGWPCIAKLAWEQASAQRDVDMARLKESQPCGHPAACIVSSDEGTSYCGWCADVARLREACEFALSYAKGEWDAVNRHPGSHHAEYVSVLSNALFDTGKEE